MSVACQKEYLINTQIGSAAYWSFDEAAGPFIDSVAARSMPRTAAMTTVAGLIGNAVSFIGTPAINQFSITPTLSFDFANPRLCMWCWIKASTLVHAANFPSGTMTIARLDAPDNLNIALVFQGTDSIGNIQYVQAQLNSTVSSNNSGFPPTAPVVPSDGNWHLMATSFNGDDGLFYFDNSAPIAWSVSPAQNWPRTIAFDTIAVGVGANHFFEPYDIDEWGIIMGASLSASDVTFLYNGGAGRAYAAVAAHFGL